MCWQGRNAQCVSGKKEMVNVGSGGSLSSEGGQKRKKVGEAGGAEVFCRADERWKGTNHELSTRSPIVKLAGGGGVDTLASSRDRATRVFGELDGGGRCWRGQERRGRLFGNTHSGGGCWRTW